MLSETYAAIQSGAALPVSPSDITETAELVDQMVAQQDKKSKS